MDLYSSHPPTSTMWMWIAYISWWRRKCGFGFWSLDLKSCGRRDWQIENHDFKTNLKKLLMDTYFKIYFAISVKGAAFSKQHHALCVKEKGIINIKEAISVTALQLWQLKYYFVHEIFLNCPSYKWSLNSWKGFAQILWGTY